MNLPLQNFSAGTTRDPDHAQLLLSRELTEVQLTRVASPKQFRLNMQSVHFGDTGIIANEFGSDTDVDVGALEKEVLLIFGHSSPSVSYVNDQPVLLTKHAAVASPLDRIFHQRRAGAGVFVLKADTEAVHRRIRELADTDTSPTLDFEKSVNLSTGSGLHVRLMVESITLLLSKEPSVINNPLLAANFNDTLLGALATLPNKYTDELLKGKPPGIAPVAVKRAEAFMETNASLPMTITDLLDVCQCSRRSLFDSFRHFRGYSPLQFLAQVRLKLAHERLQAPLPGDTVHSIALECGFSHIGRFSAAYRKGFGEQPRETLQKSSYK